MTIFRAFSSNFGKRPLAKIGKKMIDLTSKLGEINNIEQHKGSNISHKNQADDSHGISYLNFFEN